MAHGFIEAFTHILDKIHHATLAHLRSHRQGIDKHTKGVLDADVAAATGNGADIKIVITGKAGEDQQRGGECKVSRCHGMLTAELFHCLQINRTEDL